jgi:exosortase/archaeosortase family protein
MSARPRGYRFLAIFVATFAVMQLAAVSSRHYVANWLVAWPAQFTLGALYAEDGIVVDANRIESRRVRLNLLPGCEGTELFVLLIAGVLAFPAPWPAKLRGLAYGLTLAFALNQVRVIGLYAVVRDQAAAFDLVHGFVAPTALVVALGAYFWLWSGRAAHSA